ncbi:MAG: hypothetical protein Q9203_006229 [Teloschistes exilis]
MTHQFYLYNRAQTPVIVSDYRPVSTRLRSQHSYNQPDHSPKRISAKSLPKRIVPAKKPSPSNSISYKQSRRLNHVAGSRISKRSPSSKPSTRSSTLLSNTAMIKIFVNNRLGIKKEIPCSPTDTIEEFKKIAAMYMGMRSESFMLKKQEQRPMKDFLTLEDYEIGNGASLDLEVDTGEQGRK